ncbi:hypothetical protein GCM10027160_39600 [Streptomyces calidiresistens]|uniref:Band 7 domain-containing protein n=1 Tax=Streptomyces calidiresistens TaxID=1485586 RepID=A0A7W3T5W9_9ACTN|nr:SPFH domain-containing protein [Streptomyces calidiresistens]MBB0231537.1 hypothetical protein [Streptomyces calidiresistens]
MVLLLFGVIAAVAAGLLAAGVKRVRPGEVAVVERAGAHHRTLPAGTHLLVPLRDRVRARLDLGERVLLLPPRTAHAGDRHQVTVACRVRWRVGDPARAVYAAADGPRALEHLLDVEIRAAVSGMLAAEVPHRRAELEERLGEAMREAGAERGMEVLAVEFDELAPTRPEAARRLPPGVLPGPASPEGAAGAGGSPGPAGPAAPERG